MRADWVRWAALVCGVVPVMFGAACTSHEPSKGSTPTAIAPTSPAPSTTRVTLAAVPGCDDIATALGAVLQTPKRTFGQLSDDDPTESIRAQCQFDAGLNGAGNPRVHVAVEYGRFTDEQGVRTAAQIAELQAVNLVKSTCRTNPKDLPGTYTYAQACTNTDGPARSGVGLVTAGGSYAAIGIAVSGDQTPSAQARLIVGEDARRLASDLLDKLG